MTSHYSTGRAFEWKVRDNLTANGYDVVRAAGSKGGTKADLIAFKPGQLLLVQCKRRGVLPPAEWNRLVEVAGWVQALAILAAVHPTGRGIEYSRLLGPKVPRARVQACEPFALGHWPDKPHRYDDRLRPGVHALVSDESSTDPSTEQTDTAGQGEAGDPLQVWDDSIPPGGWVCAACRTPTDSPESTADTLRRYMKPGDIATLARLLAAGEG